MVEIDYGECYCIDSRKCSTRYYVIIDYKTLTTLKVNVCNKYLQYRYKTYFDKNFSVVNKYTPIFLNDFIEEIISKYTDNEELKPFGNIKKFTFEKINPLAITLPVCSRPKYYSQFDLRYILKSLIENKGRNSTNIFEWSYQSDLKGIEYFDLMTFFKSHLNRILNLYENQNTRRRGNKTRIKELRRMFKIVTKPYYSSKESSYQTWIDILSNFIHLKHN